MIFQSFWVAPGVAAELHSSDYHLYLHSSL